MGFFRAFANVLVLERTKIVLYLFVNEKSFEKNQYRSYEDFLGKKISYEIWVLGWDSSASTFANARRKPI